MNVRHLRASVLIGLVVSSFATESLCLQQRHDVITLTEQPQERVTPQRARQRLKEGNERFVQDKLSSRDLRAQRQRTQQSQKPFAAILTCQDSRTPPELIFDLDLGDAFSIRIAGNIVNDDILGGLEFAASSGVTLIVVLGHTDCGAIKGAIDGGQTGHMAALLSKIRPAVATVSAGPPRRTLDSNDLKAVGEVTRQNVLLALREIREKSPLIKSLLLNRTLDLVGGSYELKDRKSVV